MINFKRISLSDSQRYISCLQQCPEVPSDCCSSMIIGYGDVWSSTERSYDEGVCWQRAYQDGREFWIAPLGDWDHVDWKDVFTRHVPEGTRFRYVPGTLKEIWMQTMPGAFECYSDRGEWDYIYDISTFLESNPKVRSEFRRFQRQYSCETEQITASNTDAVLELDCRASERIRAKTSGDLLEFEEDTKALHVILNNWERMDNLYGLLMRVGNEYVSYNIWEVLDDRVFGLYNKNLNEYKNVHAAMIVKTDAILKEKGYKTLNMMSDGGFAGLRFNKTRRKPCCIAEKCNMIWRGMK